MKKLFFAAIFSIGLFSMSQAQVMDYYLYNASPTDNWNVAMDDAGPFPAVYEYNIVPGELRTGSIPFLFQFPLDWKAVDSNNCQVYQTVFAPIPNGITVPTTCPGTNVTYGVGVFIPFVYYYFKAEFQ